MTPWAAIHLVTVHFGFQIREIETVGANTTVNSAQECVKPFLI